MFDIEAVRMRWRDAVADTGETTDKIAVKIFMNPNTLRSELSGHRTIKLEDLALFCEVYKKDLNWIVYGGGRRDAR